MGKSTETIIDFIIKRTFELGKIAYISDCKDNLVTIEVEWNDTENGPVFSASANVWNRSKTDIVCGGQCLDSISEYLKENELFNTLYGLWQRNHLNDMDACANDEQRKAVNEYHNVHKGCSYDEVCEYLKGKGLFEVIVNGKNCKYGHEWYYREISEEDKKTIDKLMKM